MAKQEYLRPHDVTVLLQMAIAPAATFRELAERVGLSLGEAHNAVNRLQLSRLVMFDERSVNLSATLEFLVSGVPYAYPPQIGPPSRGVATAFSATPLAAEFVSDQVIVWPDAKGDTRGYTLIPLSPAAPRVARMNERLYHLLALVDAIRVGQARERKRARQYLEHTIRSMRSQWTY